MEQQVQRQHEPVPRGTPSPLARGRLQSPVMRRGSRIAGHGSSRNKRADEFGCPRQGRNQNATGSIPSFLPTSPGTQFVPVSAPSSVRMNSPIPPGPNNGVPLGSGGNGTYGSGSLAYQGSFAAVGYPSQHGSPPPLFNMGQGMRWGSPVPPPSPGVTNHRLSTAPMGCLVWSPDVSMEAYGGGWPSPAHRGPSGVMSEMACPPTPAAGSRSSSVTLPVGLCGSQRNLSYRSPGPSGSPCARRGVVLVELISVELSEERAQELRMLGDMFLNLSVRFRLGGFITEPTPSKRRSRNVTWDPPERRELPSDCKEKWLWLRVFDEDFITGSRLAAEGRVNLHASSGVGDEFVEVGVYLFTPADEGSPRRHTVSGTNNDKPNPRQSSGRTTAASGKQSQDDFDEDGKGSCCGIAMLRLARVDMSMSTLQE